MNLLYPKFPLNRWPLMLGVAVLGALIAGAYGIIHDQITYSISPEYFTRLKFEQFKWANRGWPTRVFVGEIGFLATWWVGFFAGWFLARVLAPHASPARVVPLALRGFAIVVGCALAFAAAGFLYGLRGPINVNTSEIAAIGALIGAKDLPAFTRVAYIHNAGYLGGLAGTIAASFILWRIVRRR